MSKRRNEETKEDRWRRKKMKYDQKLKKKSSYRRIIYSEEEDEEENDVMQSPEEITINNEEVAVSSPVVELERTEGIQAVDAAEEVDLFDPSLLDALGESEVDVVDFGEDIQADLASRLHKILLSGLNKDSKEDILKKYSFPKNLTFAKGPTLNLEVGAMLAEPCRLRDKRLHVKQDQLGKSLSALGIAMTNLMKKNSDIPDIIRTLNDAARLLADSHYAETDTRRSVIIPLIDKSLMDTFKDRKRDSLLFGENLGDLVRNSRGIKKTSELIQASTSSLNRKGSSSRGARNQQRGGGRNQRGGGPRQYPMNQYSRRWAPAAPQAPSQATARRQSPPPAPRRRHQAAAAAPTQRYANYQRRT